MSDLCTRDDCLLNYAVFKGVIVKKGTALLLSGNFSIRMSQLVYPPTFCCLCIALSPLPGSISSCLYIISKVNCRESMFPLFIQVYEASHHIAIGLTGMHALGNEGPS